MLAFIRSQRSALVCLAGLTCLAILLLLAVVGLFLAAFPASAQSSPPGREFRPRLSGSAQCQAEGRRGRGQQF